VIQFPCSLCHARLSAEDNAVGQPLICPACGGSIFIPPPVRAADTSPLVSLLSDVRCYRCGDRIPEGELVRRVVTTKTTNSSFSSYSSYDSGYSTNWPGPHSVGSFGGGSSSQQERVSLCRKCNWLYDEEARQRNRDFWRFVAAILIVAVMGILVAGVWIAIEVHNKRQEAGVGPPVDATDKLNDEKKPEPRPEPGLAAWKTYTSDEGGFSIDFPPERGEVVITPTNIPTKYGQATSVVYSCNAQAATGGFILQYTVYPQKMPEKVIADALVTMRKNLKSPPGVKVMAESDVTIDGNSGWDLILQSPKGDMSRLRVFQVKRRVFTLAVSFAEKIPEKFQTIFLDSLRLTRP
jgi:DNA-directed RNA polymerase subunit RPC12/RpoP